MLIGMSKDFKDFPAYFKENGYTLEIIEPSFLNSEGTKVNPDIILSSNGNLNALVAEVKKGHIQQAEVDKYNAITGDNLRTEVQDVFDLDKLESEFFIAGTPKTEESFEHLKLNEPGIIFEETQTRTRNQFNEESLTEAFSEAEIPENPPTSFYPFSADDGDAIVASKICQSMMVLAANTYGEDELEFGTEDLLDESHPYWNSISRDGQKQLITRTENIIDKLMEKGLDEHMEKIKGEDRFFVNSSKAFQKKAQKVLSELSTQETLGKFFEEE